MCTSSWLQSNDGRQVDGGSTPSIAFDGIDDGSSRRVTQGGPDTDGENHSSEWGHTSYGQEGPSAAPTPTMY